VRRIIQTSLAIVLTLSWTGCHSSKWYNGWCEANADCAMQAGFGKVCVLGRCQECGLDADCKDGFRCTDLRCVPRPECEAPADCGEGKTCTSGRCVVAPFAQVPACRAGSGGLACRPGQACVEGTSRTDPIPKPCRTLASVHLGKGSASLTERWRTTLPAEDPRLAAQRDP
jgi:peptidoglycan-associated lipoprotein